MHFADVLIKPVLSEKSTRLSEEKKPKYVFIVNKKANKPMVSRAIEEKYGVRPESIKIIRRKGKWKRVRREYGLTSEQKRAVVCLPRGKSIDLFSEKT